MGNRVRLAVLVGVLVLLLMSWAVLIAADAHSSHHKTAVAKATASGAGHSCQKGEGGDGCSMQHQGASCGGGCAAHGKSSKTAAKSSAGCSGHKGGACSLHKPQSAHLAKPGLAAKPKHTAAHRA